MFAVYVLYEQAYRLRKYAFCTKERIYHKWSVGYYRSTIPENNNIGMAVICFH